MDGGLSISRSLRRSATSSALAILCCRISIWCLRSPLVSRRTVAVCIGSESEESGGEDVLEPVRSLVVVVG